MFFAVSGYLLLGVSGSFRQWYGKRLKRIVPAMFAVALMDMIFFGRWRDLLEMSPAHAALYYFLHYWFCGAILLYCIFYYFVFRWAQSRERKKRNARVTLALWLAGYVLLYALALDKTVFSVELNGFSWFKVYFYFGVFIFGAWLRIVREELERKLTHSRKGLAICALLCVLSFCVWTAEYALVFVYGKGLDWQFLIHLGVLGWTGTAIALSWRLLDRMPPGWVDLLSRATLEIYLVQGLLGGVVGGKGIGPFPANAAIFWATALGGGLALNLAWRKVAGYLEKITGKS